MSLHGCHKCRDIYPQDAMGIDMEIHHNLTEFKGIFRIHSDSSQEEFSFSIYDAEIMVSTLDILKTLKRLIILGINFLLH